jgi:hypothetical protein
MARTVCVEHDPEAFRRALEDPGFLRPGAPLSTQAVVEHLAAFYDTIRKPGPLTITGDYASTVVRRFFDVRSPVADYISVPQSYVILQRINLGLFAVLGELSATAKWRDRRGNLALRPWPRLHPDGRSRGRMESASPGNRGVTGEEIAALQAKIGPARACRAPGQDTWPWSRRLADPASEGDARDHDAPTFSSNQEGSRGRPPAGGGSTRHIHRRRLPRGSPAGPCEDICP